MLKHYCPLINIATVLKLGYKVEALSKYECAGQVLALSRMLISGQNC